MRALRSLLALLLSLSLFWSSAQQALAHAGMAGGMEVTLCSDSGQKVTIHLDANGNPAPPHDCVECLAAQAPGALPGHHALPRPAPASRAAFRAPLPLAAPVLPPPLPLQARAPPSAV